MIKCPRCQNSIDETKRTACPVCLTPLAAPGASPAGAPVYTPPPGGAAPVPMPPPRSTPAAAPYSPPPGSPYTPPPAPGYAPPPGSPYSTPPLPGASLPPQQPAPGFAPPTATRTTLTGEVVPVSTPSPARPSAYIPNGYTPPPTALPYDSGAPQPKAAGRGWGFLNWRLAGGASIGGVYIVIRLIALCLRLTHPYHSYNSYDPPSTPSYSNDYRSYSTTPSYPTSASQPTMPVSSAMPSQYPSGPSGPPTHFNYQPHFQPTAPRGFASHPSSLPGSGSFGAPNGGFGSR